MVLQYCNWKTCVLYVMYMKEWRSREWKIIGIWDFCAVLVDMKKKFRPCRHFLWNSNSYSQPSNVSHHGGMNADHADCSTSYSSWFWCFLSLNFLYYCLIADKRQTCVLVALIVIMIVVIILFVALWGLQKRCRQKCRIDFQFSGVCRRKAITHVTLYTLTLAIIFSTLFSLHFLQYLQGEFIWQSGTLNWWSFPLFSWP